MLVFNLLPRDIWIASSTCQSTCAGTGNFDATKSSTFENLNRQFNVTYESGEAVGTFGRDVIHMAGFTVTNQEFGNINNSIGLQLSVPILMHDSGGDIHVAEVLAKSCHWIIWSCMAITVIFRSYAVLAGACK